MSNEEEEEERGRHRGQGQGIGFNNGSLVTLVELRTEPVWMNVEKRSTVTEGDVSIRLISLQWMDERMDRGEAFAIRYLLGGLFNLIKPGD